MIRFLQFLRAVARAFWRNFGGPHVVLNMMATCIIAGCIVLAWWAFEPIEPLQTAEVLAVEPINRVVDRDHDDELKITRRICMRWGAWGNVTRSFVGATDDGIEYKMAAVRPLFLPKGCHERTRVVEVPATLAPGQYVYRSVIQFCIRRGCVDALAQDVPVTIRGAWPSQPSGPPLPMREPL